MRELTGLALCKLSSTLLFLFKAYHDTLSSTLFQLPTADVIICVQRADGFAVLNKLIDRTERRLHDQETTWEKRRLNNRLR